MPESSRSAALHWINNNTLTGIKAGPDRASFLDIWMVTMGERIFARSWGFAEKSWYNTFLQHPYGQIRCGENVFHIRAGIPADRQAITPAIDAAYLAKYDYGDNAPYARGIIRPEHAAKTMEFEVVDINYHNKVFRPVHNTNNGETSGDTLFRYRQEGNILSADYAGGRIVKGHLLGLVDRSGVIRMHYHQVNDRSELMTGTCTSTPEILPDGRIRLHESWQWTSGDHSSGTSVVEEVAADE